MKYLFLIPLLALACGLSIVSTENYLPQLSVAPVPLERGVEMVVRGQLYVRYAPNGEIVEEIYYLPGDIVTIYRVEVVGDFSWCRITPLDNLPRYVACDWLSDSESKD